MGQMGDASDQAGRNLSPTQCQSSSGLSCTKLHGDVVAPHPNPNPHPTIGFLCMIMEGGKTLWVQNRSDGWDASAQAGRNAPPHTVGQAVTSRAWGCGRPTP
jgi:hypothetical protein